MTPKSILVCAAPCGVRRHEMPRRNDETVKQFKRRLADALPLPHQNQYALTARGRLLHDDDVLDDSLDVLNVELRLRGGAGGPFIRLAANLIIAGTGVVGRAFVEAYKQALAGGGAAAARAGNAGANRASALEAEARQILNVKQSASPEEITSAFDSLHAMNDPAKGGSSYLQAKVTFARDTLIKRPEEPAAGSGDSGSSGGSAAKAEGDAKSKAS